jgi:hypothetical protein
VSAPSRLDRGAWLVVVLAIACDESSSGADRQAKRSRFEGNSESSGATGGTGAGGAGKAGAANQDCGDVTEVGSCLGTAITFCAEGTLISDDCRKLGAACTCAFDEDARRNDCFCEGLAGTGGSGGIGGGAGGGAGGASAGMSGGSAAGIGGGSAGAESACLEAGARCGETTASCCADHRCVSYDEAAAVCAAACTRNSECANGCCALLSDFGGACGPVATCGGAGCRPRGASCDSAPNCCQDAPTTCVDPDRGGPKVCSALCTTNSDCEDDCCRTDSHGVRACFPAEFCR